MIDKTAKKFVNMPQGLNFVFVANAKISRALSLRLFGEDITEASKKIPTPSKVAEGSNQASMISQSEALSVVEPEPDAELEEEEIGDGHQIDDRDMDLGGMTGS